MLVLVADDDEDITFMVVQALRLEGIEAKEWTTDFAALLFPVPWVGVTVGVIDLHLGAFDGEDVLVYLRDNHPTIRRVLFSGSRPENLPGGLRFPALCDEIVLKGDMSKLLEAIRG